MTAEDAAPNPRIPFELLPEEIEYLLRTYEVSSIEMLWDLWWTPHNFARTPLSHLTAALQVFHQKAARARFGIRPSGHSNFTHIGNRIVRHDAIGTIQRDIHNDLAVLYADNGTILAFVEGVVTEDDFNAVVDLILTDGAGIEIPGLDR